jgi:hypothetical protein
VSTTSGVRLLPVHQPESLAMSNESAQDPARASSTFSLILDSVVRICEHGRYAAPIILACCLGPATIVAAARGYRDCAIILASAAALPAGAAGIAGSIKRPGGKSISELSRKKDEIDTT